MNVLIVDDSKEITTFLQIVLENENHRIKTAINGEEGYLVYLDFRPDVVITDIQMPKKNGFELIKDIRMHDANIKAIYISGSPHLFGPLLEGELRAYDSAFLKKPFSIAELKRVLSAFNGK